MINKQEERLVKILNILKLSNPATVNKLAQLLEVSHMTIRRDIEILEKENKVEVFHGGIMLLNRGKGDEWKEYSLANATTVMCEEKKRIGMKAALLLQDNDSIILDTGSTTEFISRSINPDLSLSIICFTLNALINVSKLKKVKLFSPADTFTKTLLCLKAMRGYLLLRKTAHPLPLSPQAASVSLWE